VELSAGKSPKQHEPSCGLAVVLPGGRRIEKVILDRVRGCRPGHAKQLWFRFVFICGLWRVVAHARPVSTMHFRPCRVETFVIAAYLDAAQLVSVTHVGRTDRKDCGTERSCCC
jgi:hypothetical protein